MSFWETELFDPFPPVPPEASPEPPALALLTECIEREDNFLSKRAEMSISNILSSEGSESKTCPVPVDDAKVSAKKSSSFTSCNCTGI